MILGIGTDICEIARIERTLARFGERFLTRIFTPAEIAKATRRPTMAPTLAKRFAAKEACAKALGTGMSQGVFWRDIGVVNAPSGQPMLILTGGAAKRLTSLLPEGMTAHLHLALTDETAHAQAFVVIEALPK